MNQPSTTTFTLDVIDVQILRLLAPTMGCPLLWIARKIKQHPASVCSRLGRLSRDGLLVKVDAVMWRLSKLGLQLYGEPTQ